MVVALDRAALQFQSPSATVDVKLSGDTYTLRRDIGSGRYWAVDLVGETVFDRFVRSLGTHRIEGTGAATLGVTGSAWERALTVDGTFIGTRAHGYETDTDIAVLVDGVAVTPTGTPTTGKRVVVDRRSTMFSPSTDLQIGTARTVYTMTRQGLAVDWAIRWSADATSGQCYGAMMPCAALLDTGKTTGGSKATLTNADDSMNSSSQSNTAWLWDADGSYGAAMAIRNPNTVRSWGASDSKDLWIQDRTGGSVNKIYAGYTGPSIAPGDIWSGSVLYVADFFAAGAAAVLDF